MVGAHNANSALGADYERIQHERLSARLGQSPQWIGEVTGSQAISDSVLTPHEKVVRDLAAATLLRSGLDIQPELAAAVAALGPKAAIAALVQVSRYIQISVLCNALKLELPANATAQHEVQLNS
jgi:hypothetical protein